MRLNFYASQNQWHKITEMDVFGCTASVKLSSREPSQVRKQMLPNHTVQLFPQNVEI